MNRDMLKGDSIYCVFIRNHSESGDILSLTSDLPRIKKMGITTIWLMPHYPIGLKNRKGKIGSPYAISDYIGVNPDIGGLNDFKDLLKSAHNLDLKVVIDIVFNHTSSDSELVTDHPNWFLQNKKGNPISKISLDGDICDLNFNSSEMKNYLINVLHYWADIGVDGFRCDNAAIVPLSFWKMAKDTLSSDYPNLIWLGESATKEFVSFIRHKGFQCHSDSELYNVFDILYDYDTQNIFEGYLNGEETFETFINERRNQEVIYPINYIKLRFLENPDSINRIASFIQDDYILKNLKAFSVFENGVPLIYAGEEYKIIHQPSLINIDKINWDSSNIDSSYFDFIKSVLRVENLDIISNGIYTINPLAEDCVHLRYRFKGETLHGIFNFKEQSRAIRVDVLSGEYLNILTQKTFKIGSELLNLEDAPFIFKSIP